MFFKIGVLKYFIDFTGKRLRWSPFLIKLRTSRPAALLKRDSNAGVFLQKFAKFLRTPFFTAHLWWLLLDQVTFRKVLLKNCHNSNGSCSRPSTLPYRWL